MALDEEVSVFELSIKISCKVMLHSINAQLDDELDGYDFRECFTENG